MCAGEHFLQSTQVHHSLWLRWTQDLEQEQVLSSSHPSSMGQSTHSFSAAQGHGQPSNSARSDNARSDTRSDDATESSHIMPNASSSGDESVRWIFSSQQMRLSVEQMDVYTMHRAAAEEVDEDFFGNFS